MHESAPIQESTSTPDSILTPAPTMEMPELNPTAPSDIAIQNPKLSSLYSSKISDNLMMIAEEEGNSGKRYGYINYKGDVVIPVQYTYAEDFYNGCAIVSSELGTGVINTRGEEIIPLTYVHVVNNGCYLIASTKQDCDIYSLSGDYCGSLNASAYNFADGNKLIYANNCPLFAVPDGRKMALATGTGVITDALYDSVTPYGDSNFAVLKVGEMSALAGPKGIIFNLSANRLYVEAIGNYALVHEYDYSANPQVDRWAIVDVNGNTSEFVSGWFGGLCVGNGVVSAYHSSYRDCIVYDITTGQTYVDGSVVYTSDGFLHFSHIEFPDGRCMLRDGTWCLSVDQQKVTNMRDNYRGSYCIYQDVNGKYGLCFEGFQYTNAIYDSPEEVWKNYGYYKEDKLGGKPAIVFGNENIGFTPVIQLGDNDLPYDEIISLGEDYYACRFNETWYLVHL